MSIMNKLQELQNNFDVANRAVTSAQENIDVDACDEDLSLAFDHYYECVDLYGDASNTLEDYRRDNATKADRRIRDKTINRFEVIDETGRVIVKYGVSVELLYQDDGRTLKVVLQDIKLRENHES